jgi:hypothetical protein
MWQLPLGSAGHGCGRVLEAPTDGPRRHAVDDLVRAQRQLSGTKTARATGKATHSSTVSVRLRSAAATRSPGRRPPRSRRQGRVSSRTCAWSGGVRLHQRVAVPAVGDRAATGTGFTRPPRRSAQDRVDDRAVALCNGRGAGQELRLPASGRRRLSSSAASGCRGAEPHCSPWWRGLLLQRGQRTCRETSTVSTRQPSA